MSKGFNYSKWDNIELSDDEEDCHPNIDKESWFRLKHRSRVEREDNEAKDKARILKEMDTAQQRIKVLEHDLKKAQQAAADDSDDDDEDLDDTEGMKAELATLRKENAARQAKLDEYEKNKKWNVDNMFEVKDERTIVNPAAGEMTYSASGFAKPKEELKKVEIIPKNKNPQEASSPKAAAAAPKTVTKTATTTTITTAPKRTAPKAAGPKPPPSPNVPPPGPVEVGAFETYPEFTERYADLVERFMKVPDLAGSKEFLLQHGSILLQENASNYLLLAALEDEMNGNRAGMQLTARQSQLVSSIAEMAKTVDTHPGNVIQPFFMRLEQREHLEEFLRGVKTFTNKIIARAVVKKQEMDEQRASAGIGGQSLEEIPVEERVGPGGLDPLEVIETLPVSMIEAFESRDVEQLKQALAAMEPAEAEMHMKRCVDSGLWVAGG